MQFGKENNRFLQMTDEQTVHRLLDYISERVSISPSDKKKIAAAYVLKNVKKKEFILQQGVQNKMEAFVLNGTFRVYYADSKGSEHVLYFAFRDWWIGDMATFDTGKPSILSAQALEDSTVLWIDPIEKDKLYQEVPALERLFRLITQKHLAVLQKRFLLTVSSNAVERYQELIERSPGIEQLVPQHQIASYLGILPESLSRLKRQLISEL